MVLVSLAPGTNKDSAPLVDKGAVIAGLAKLKAGYEQAVAGIEEIQKAVIFTSGTNCSSVFQLLFSRSTLNNYF